MPVRTTILPTVGLVLAILVWIFGYFSFVFAFGDPIHDDPAELRRIVTQRAYLSMLFTSLTILSLFAATWLSGYTLAVAKIRASLAALCCGGFTVMVLWLFVVDNLFR